MASSRFLTVIAPSPASGLPSRRGLSAGLAGCYWRVPSRAVWAVWARQRDVASRIDGARSAIKRRTSWAGAETDTAGASPPRSLASAARRAPHVTYCWIPDLGVSSRRVDCRPHPPRQDGPRQAGFTCRLRDAYRFQMPTSSSRRRDACRESCFPKSAIKRPG